MTGRLRVVVADDHYLVREGVRRALVSDGSIDVIAVVGDAAELERVVDRERPDAVVTDIRMPPGHSTEGIEAAHRIRERHHGIGIVVLSQYNDATYAMDLLRDGTAGMAYLLKERIGDPRALLEAVKEVASGGSRIDPDVVASLVHAGRSTSRLADLTERERDVLALIAQGRTNAAVAEGLHLSESSVEKYASSVFVKLGLSDERHVHRRVAAVLAYLQDQQSAQPLDG
jgi:DNA-binding NarL/FixJ family response regulator